MGGGVKIDDWKSGGGGERRKTGFPSEEEEVGAGGGGDGDHRSFVPLSSLALKVGGHIART